MPDKHDCGNHGSRFRAQRVARGCCGCLLCWLMVALIAVLIVFLVLRPRKPRFYVQEAAVRQWNATTDNLLTSSLQFAIVSRNPNKRIGIYYASLSAYAAYFGQQITPSYPLTAFYQGHKDINILTVILHGQAVPVAPFVADRLRFDQQNGVTTLNLRLGGRIQWKVGSWTSRLYRLHVNCFTVLGFGSSGMGGPVALQAGTRCDVDV